MRTFPPCRASSDWQKRCAPVAGRHRPHAAQTGRLRLGLGARRFKILRVLTHSSPVCALGLRTIGKGALMANWLKRLLGGASLEPTPTLNEPELPPKCPKNAEPALAEPWDMEVVKSFRSPVAGVSHINDDGTSRQKLLARCYLLEPLRLIAEPSNPVDPFAVKVCRMDGSQIGYVPQGEIKPRDLAMGRASAQLTSVARPFDGAPYLGALMQIIIRAPVPFPLPLMEIRTKYARRCSVNERLKLTFESGNNATRREVRRSTGTVIGMLDAAPHILKALERCECSLKVKSMNIPEDDSKSPIMFVEVTPF